MEDNNIEFHDLRGTEGIPASILEAAKKIGQKRRRWYDMIKAISHRIGMNRLAEEDLVVSIGCGDGLDSLPRIHALATRARRAREQVSVIWGPILPTRGIYGHGCPLIPSRPTLMV